MFVFLNQTLGRFHRVKRFADLVEASTKTAMLLLKQRSFFYRRFAVLVEDSTKTVNLLTRWNLPSMYNCTYTPNMHFNIICKKNKKNVTS